MSAALKKPFQAAPGDSVIGRDICARLSELAPQHQRAALRKARALAKGLAPDYEIPSIDILARAENPPEKIWLTGTIPVPEKPGLTEFQIEADRLLHDPQWLAGLPAISKVERERRALLTAEMNCWRAWKQGAAEAAEIDICANYEEYSRGQELSWHHAPFLAALGEVLDLIEDLIPNSHFAALPDSEIEEIAEKKAEQARRRYEKRAQDALIRWGEIIKAPEPTERRQMCQIWHRRQLRHKAADVRQHLATALGTVGRGGRPYADDYTLERHREMRESAEKWAAERELRSPCREKKVSMAEIVAAGKDGAVRRLRTMTRGLDDYAIKHNLSAIFITMTLPPELHFNPQHGTANPRLNPKEVDREARLLWQRFRARLSSNRLRCLGFRVWEPHKDSTPHIHALLYLDEAGQIATVDDILLDLCPEPKPPPRDEHGRRKRVTSIASRLEIIDRHRGSGASYLSKYLTEVIASEIDGDATDEASTKLMNAERVRATASERRWRRYGFLGVHGIQRIWQRIVGMNKMEYAGAPDAVRSIKRHIEAHRYCEALECLGAIKSRDEDGKTKKPLLKLDYEEKETQYGDVSRRAVSMSAETLKWMIQLSRGWTCEKIEHPKAAGSKTCSNDNTLTVIISYPRAGPTSQPLAWEEDIECETEQDLSSDLPANWPPDDHEDLVL